MYQGFAYYRTSKLSRSSLTFVAPLIASAIACVDFSVCIMSKNLKQSPFLWLANFKVVCLHSTKIFLTEACQPLVSPHSGLQCLLCDRQRLTAIRNDTACSCDFKEYIFVTACLFLTRDFAMTLTASCNKRQNLCCSSFRAMR